MANIDKVRDFFSRWEAKDIEGIVDAFSDTPFYHNIPMEPLTSKDSIFDKARGRIVGSEEYLTKPFTRDDLLQAVSRHSND